MAAQATRLGPGGLIVTPHGTREPTQDPAAPPGWFLDTDLAPHGATGTQLRPDERSVWIGSLPTRTPPDTVAVTLDANDDTLVRVNTERASARQPFIDRYLPGIGVTLDWRNTGNVAGWAVTNAAHLDRHVLIETRPDPDTADERPLRPGESRHLPPGSHLLILRSCRPADLCRGPDHRPTPPVTGKATHDGNFAHAITVEVPVNKPLWADAAARQTTRALTAGLPFASALPDFRISSIRKARALAVTYGPAFLQGRTLPDEDSRAWERIVALGFDRSTNDDIAEFAFINKQVSEIARELNRLEGLDDDLLKGLDDDALWSQYGIEKMYARKAGFDGTSALMRRLTQLGVLQADPDKGPGALRIKINQRMATRHAGEPGFDGDFWCITFPEELLSPYPSRG